MRADVDEELRGILLRAEQHGRAGDRGAEVAELKHAISLRGDLHSLHARLGLLLHELGDPAAAIAHFEAATRLRPGDARAWNNLSAALLAIGRANVAERAARKAAAADPSHPWAHFNLGRALAAQGRSAEAREAFATATRVSPSNALAWEALGTSWLEEGRLVRAREALLRATECDPGRASAWSRLASSYLHAGDAKAALEAMARAEALGPADAAQIGSTRLVALHYDSALTRDRIFDEHVAWAGRHAPTIPQVAFKNSRDPARRLRIGYVSPRFHGDSIASLLAPVLEGHDRSVVEVRCYSTYAADNETSSRIRERVDEWIDASSLDDDALARRMRDDAVDIAVDLAGHAPGNRLLAFARRPAPVAATWLDYFDTTGLACMDYLVTDAAHSPEKDGQRFTEELWRLPRVRFAYAPPPDAPDVRAPPLSRGGGAPVLGSFNRSAKLSAATLESWRLALRRIPDSRLLIKNSSLGHEDERSDLARRLRACGIDPKRVEFRGFSAHRDMLDEYNDVDVVLDTMPYNGGITTLEALWMGKPVVTVRGDTLISRQSAALLEAADLAGWIARDADQFAAIAAGLVEDPLRLAAIGTQMRARLAASPLLDARGLSAALEAAYRGMWRRYVDRSARPAA